MPLNPTTPSRQGLSVGTPLTVTLGLDVLALPPRVAGKLGLLGLFLVVLRRGIAVGFFSPRRCKESPGA